MRGSILFSGKKTSAKVVARANLISILNAKVLLAEPKRHELIQGIVTNLGLSKSQFQNLCLPLIEELAEACQQLPSSQHRFYTRLGGLLDFVLYRGHAASLLFRQNALPPETKTLSTEQARIGYALFSAALMRGMGVLSTDYHIELFDESGQYLNTWRAIWERFNEYAHFYQSQFNEKPVSELSAYLTPLLARKWMPAEGFQWIAEDPELLLSWLQWLQEEKEGGGLLEAILERAEAMAFQEIMKAALQVNIHLYPEARIPSFVEANPSQQPLELIGLKFLMWLKENLARGQMVLNQAHLTVLENGLLIEEETFKWFIAQHSEFKNWRLVQKGLMSLGLHQEDIGQINGLLLKNPERFFSKDVIARQAGQMHHIRVQTLGLIQANNWRKLAQGKSLDLEMINQRLNAQGQLEKIQVLEKNIGLNKNG